MENIKKIGKNSGEISESITLLQLHYHILVYTVDYIHFKRTNLFGVEESINTDVDYLTDNILNILKKVINDN